MAELVSSYDYCLPAELVASHPPARRDDARMLVLERATGTLTDSLVRDLPDYLRPGDLALLNDSKVIRARLVDGGREIFLIERIAPRVWKALVRPGRRFRAGTAVPFLGHVVTTCAVAADGTREIAFDVEPDIERIGALPIPPYLRRPAEASDDTRYQTVYAVEPGSVAAPTAGLHFTPDLLSRIPHAFLTLHVGAGTFLPVKSATIDEHLMHEEAWSLPSPTADAANAANRIVAIGTTVARVLESQPPGPLRAGSGRTSIFIYPPRDFVRVGALLTNFHLPRSTLLMLVCAFAGREPVLAAYREAVRMRYRFFSYGDCMLIL